MTKNRVFIHSLVYSFNKYTWKVGNEKRINNRILRNIIQGIFREEKSVMRQIIKNGSKKSSIPMEPKGRDFQRSDHQGQKPKRG